MRLKSIKLVGFKSFVDSTVVPFPTNMTAIVGPNGCGKSNVIDAVRWVMGESSAKHLRGESMTDVIFNGSTHRQPVGQASIELLFDNSQGTLVGEHAAFTEISIKRRVTREGVSQYFLNGSKCRRRDVTDIFLGTGMGPRSYAIIEQGMISRLIESKPEELRVYLEEAAGISKYKERRRETENRMRRTQENLDRLTDIREELGKQLSTLKRQANAAERYAEYKSQERKSEALLSALIWQSLQESKAAHQAACAELEQQVEDLVLDKAAGQSSIEATRSELEEALEAFQALQGRYYHSGAEIAKLEQELKFERQRAEKAAEEQARVKDDIRRAEERSRLLCEEIADREQELETLAPEIEILREEGVEQAERVAEAEHRFQSWLHENEALQESYSQARSDADAQQARVTQFESAIHQYNARLVALNDEVLQLAEDGESGDSESLAEEQATLEERRELLSDQIAEKEIQQEAHSVKQLELDQALAELREQLSSNKAVLASLKTLQQNALKSEQREKDSFRVQATELGLRPLIDSLEIEDDWGRVVEALLGEALHGFVGTERDLELLQVASRAQEFVALYFSDGQNEPVIKGHLAEKVSGCNALNSQLNRYLCADTFEQALIKRKGLESGQSIVTKEGFVLDCSSVRSLSVSSEDEGVVVRQAKIEELERLIAMQGESLEKARIERDEFDAERKDVAASISVVRKEQDQLSRRAAALSAELSALGARREQLSRRKQRVESEMLEIKGFLEDSKSELEESREAWQLAMASLDSMSEQRHGHGEQRDALRSTIEQARDAQRDVQSKLHALELSQQKGGDRLDVLRHSTRDIEESMESMKAALEALADQETDLEKVEQLQGKLQDELVAHEKDERKLKEARAEQEALQSRLREAEVKREKSEASLLDLRSQLEQRRLQVQAREIEQEQKLKAIVDDGFELTDLQEELSASAEITEESLNKELERLASKVQRLGPINLAAVDEYETQSERKTYLDDQNEELVEALATLEGAIRKIDKETRARFKETYDRVNAGLQDLFPKIFGGGSAKLELTDSDLLETGVSIIARPPGKNNSTIHLLSGGEKALTALALIFSIFKLNPAPFCMLDEVDAPLDDANVGRFARLVKEMSSTVQFIYISHNKVSMEMADQLMGVTMHEPGVSRLVSVDIDAAAQLAEA